MGDAGPEIPAPLIHCPSESLRQFDVKESRRRVTASANAAEIKRHRCPRAKRQIGAEVIKPAEVLSIVARPTDITESSLLKSAAADVPQILRAAQAQMMRVETQAHVRVRLQPQLA